MIDNAELIHMAFWPVVTLIILVVAVLTVILLINYFFGAKEIDLSVYIKRQYLFDSKPEFELFKILMEKYHDRFYIFPQVHYSNLIQPRRDLPPKERFGYFSRIDRKSADFVLCDKEKISPQLIIELDGPTHDLPIRQKRDEFINEITKITELKILHLKTQNMAPDFLIEEIEKALSS